ncbi:MAG: endonuclease/exonuclease/phosphatase family protein, partial [SAR202 cluster bacterium]|nr:endonuclease/exonuclease/phosphatase family protein [SAR202 cluster bacterium]
MTFRIATLNLQQDLNQWEKRRELICQQLGELRPDLFALNEISVPLQTGRWLQRSARERLGLPYALVQQTRASASSEVDAEGLLTRFPVVETGNLDYRARDAVAAVSRVEIEGHQVDIYVTHLYGSRGEDPLRHYQVQQLLEWIGARNDVSHQVVCGDFNATMDVPSASLMAGAFRPSQIQPTAFTPLREPGG